MVLRRVIGKHHSCKRVTVGTKRRGGVGRKSFFPKEREAALGLCCNSAVRHSDLATQLPSKQGQGEERVPPRPQLTPGTPRDPNATQPLEKPRPRRISNVTTIEMGDALNAPNRTPPDIAPTKRHARAPYCNQERRHDQY